MGLLDQVVGALGGAQGGGHGGGQAELIHAVIGMLGSGSGSQSGGLGELVARFQQGGLGDQCQQTVGGAASGHGGGFPAAGDGAV